MIVLTALSLPLMMKTPIDLPPIISVELIEISDITNIPFAPKARKTLEKIKKEEERVVSEQAPPAKIKKEKPDRIPLPEDLNKEKKKLVKKKQNPEEIKEQIRQVSEFEKKELFDPNQIAALIDKSKQESAKTLKKDQKLTQSNVIKTAFTSGLTLSQGDALKAQIYGCWMLPLGLPYEENMLVRIKLRLRPDGTILRSVMLDHERMNKPGQEFFKVLAESALRAVRICQPLRVPPAGYNRWKDLQLNFNANEILKG